MSRSRLRASRAIATLCALSVGSCLIPTTVWADTSPPSSQPTPLRAAVHRAATLEHHRLDLQKVDGSRQPVARAQQGSEAAALQSGSFFKTPVGIAVLAAFGAGVGYTLYSVSNDRIRSVGR